MKPALFFAIARNPYGSTWHVVGVTTVGGLHWWGRRADGYGATHGKHADLRGRFPLASQAEAVLDQVQAIENERREQIRRLGEERAALDRACDERIKALVSAVTLPVGGDA